ATRDAPGSRGRRRRRSGRRAWPRGRLRRGTARPIAPDSEGARPRRPGARAVRSRPGSRAGRRRPRRPGGRPGAGSSPRGSRPIPAAPTRRSGAAAGVIRPRAVAAGGCLPPASARARRPWWDGTGVVFRDCFAVVNGVCWPASPNTLGRMSHTLSEKVWERHVVHRATGEPDLLYVDLHLVHEVTSPQAFDGLRLHGRAVRRPDLTISTIDPNTPPTSRDRPVEDPISAKQMDVLARNCAEFGIRLYGMGDPGRGIVHVIGPEQGLTQPGLTIVCGDSHTSTHGAFGALAFGIGTSEVEHVLATQTLPQVKPGTMAVTVDGMLDAGVTAKDLVLSIIARIGTGGGIGSIIEYRGSAVRSLSMEGRMTVCNMSIEAGARAGM